MKSHNKFYQDISIAKGFSSEEMFRFPLLLKPKKKTRLLLKKITSYGKEIRNEWHYPWNSFSEISNKNNEENVTINEENVIIAPRQGKKEVPILSDKFCEQIAVP